MKRLSRAIAIILCVGMLSGCAVSQDALDEAWWEGYEEGYDSGYEEGYEYGIDDGVFECKKDFAEAVRDRYFDVEHATKNGRDFHPEEAIMVLNDYLDGKYVSDAELESAIESISDFYYDWQSVIADIEDLDVDVDFN